MFDLVQNLGMREWLIIAGLLLVLSVLFDGIRRMRKDRANNIKLSKNLDLNFSENDDDSMPELPNGGARVISRTDPVISDQIEGDLFSDQSNEEETDHETLRPDPEEIIVIHVKSKSDDGFVGSDLLQVILACELRFGEKDIFHSYLDPKKPSTLQFSLANMMEPGTFDLDNINSFRTPGVTFFMTLPSNTDPIESFDRMIETASSLVNNLSAKMYDEEHKAMNQKKLSRYKSRVAKFSDNEIKEKI